MLITGRPQITASLVTLASMGDDVTLTCSVDAHPPPTLGFTRDANALEQIGNSTKYQVAVKSRSRVRLIYPRVSQSSIKLKFKLRLKANVKANI